MRLAMYNEQGIGEKSKGLAYTQAFLAHPLSSIPCILRVWLRVWLLLWLCVPVTAQTLSSAQIAPGANGQVLTTQNGVPQWVTPGTGGTVTSITPGTTPSWLTFSITNPTSTPQISAAASAIPVSALASSSTTVNGQVCALGESCTVGAPGAALLNPSASQTVQNGIGINFSVASPYMATSYNTTGNTTSGIFGSAAVTAYPANAFQLENHLFEDIGTGYDLGNNGTSAQGWATGTSDFINYYSAIQGIMDGVTMNYTHDGIGDSDGFYFYESDFGGGGEASGEGVTGGSMQTHQRGYKAGTLGDGQIGTNQNYGSNGSGYEYVNTENNGIRYTSQISTLSIFFYSAPTAQTDYFFLATPNGGTSYSITNVIPVSVTATSGEQTFTSGSGFSPVTATVGQVVGFYVPSGTGPAHGSNTGVCLATSGVPTTGTFTFQVSSPACSDWGGVSLIATMAPPTTGATTIDVENLTVNGYNDANNFTNWDAGGMLFDETQSEGTATLAPTNTGSGTFTLATGTVPVSLAWGTLTGSTCTGNGNGQNQAYTSTTCTVTLGTSPASPNNFVAGTDVCLNGAFDEEAAVTAVGAVSSGTQSITFNTRYAYNTGTTQVMQGPPCGEAMVNTAVLSSWPIASPIVGAYTSTTPVVATCSGAGTCATEPPVGLSSNVNSESPILTRTSNIVSASPNPYNMNVTNYPVGSTVVVSGYTPSDLNGTFTVTTNSYDNQNPVLQWAQTGSNETSTTEGTIAQPDVAVTIVPYAYIEGSCNNSNGCAQLATNHVPFVLGDALVGAPDIVYSGEGLYDVWGQNSPQFAYQSSLIQLQDDGPAGVGNVIRINGGATDGTVLSEINHFYTGLSFGYRPLNNGSLIYEQGTEPLPGNAKPYNLFFDDGWGVIGVDPLNGYFTFAGDGASSIAIGSTIIKTPQLGLGSANPDTTTPSATMIGEGSPQNGNSSTTTAGTLGWFANSSNVGLDVYSGTTAYNIFTASTSTGEMTTLGLSTQDLSAGIVSGSLGTSTTTITPFTSFNGWVTQEAYVDGTSIAAGTIEAVYANSPPGGGYGVSVILLQGTAPNFTIVASSGTVVGGNPAGNLVYQLINPIQVPGPGYYLGIYYGSPNYAGFSLISGGTGYYLASTSMPSGANTYTATTSTIAMQPLYVGGTLLSGSFQPSSTRYTYSCSTGGSITTGPSTADSITFTEPLAGVSDRKVLIYESSCTGAVSFTYPTAFTFTPSASLALANTITTVSTTAVTVTGTGGTGFASLEGF